MISKSSKRTKILILMLTVIVIVFAIMIASYGYFYNFYNPTVQDLDFFQPQRQLFCGLHAINNMLGQSFAQVDSLNQVCLEFQHPSEHCHISGWYSTELIIRFMEKYGFNIQIVLYFELEEFKNIIRKHTQTWIGALVCNGTHWIALRPINKKIFWIDSNSRKIHSYDNNDDGSNDYNNLESLNLLVQDLKRFANRERIELILIFS
jgi:hypothetical protein